jgi:Domain of unknown function (DUF4167)
MRPGQNGKRTRRGRKPHNFSNRTFDSNGPDVKIRGTAAHIFEKYQALARDANASGDRIGAENYLQHAEHYFRILNTYQNNPNQPFNGRPQGQPQGDGPQPQFGRPQSDDAEGEDSQDGADEAEEAEDIRA